MTGSRKMNRHWRAREKQQTSRRAKMKWTGEMTVEPKEPFLKFFEQLDRARPAATLQPLRQAGRNRFRSLQLPSRHTEDWRFTSIAPLLQTPFELVNQAPAIDPGLLPALPTADAIRLTFVNGRFAANLSKCDRLPAGVSIGNLASATPEQIRQLTQIANGQDQVFTALNTALLQDGAFVVVPDGILMQPVIEILYIAHAAGKQPSIQPRALFVAGKNSQATLVERFLAIGDESATYFTNAVTEIAVGAGANVDHYKVQQESLAAYHVANTQAVMAQAANFTTHYIALGGGLVRNEVRVRFDCEGGEATVNGLYLGGGKQHLDNYTVIDHAQPRCASHEFYKGVL